MQFLRFITLFVWFWFPMNPSWKVFQKKGPLARHWVGIAYVATRYFNIFCFKSCRQIILSKSSFCPSLCFFMLTIPRQFPINLLNLLHNSAVTVIEGVGCSVRVSWYETRPIFPHFHGSRNFHEYSSTEFSCLQLIATSHSGTPPTTLHFFIFCLQRLPIIIGIFCYTYSL